MHIYTYTDRLGPTYICIIGLEYVLLKTEDLIVSCVCVCVCVCL